MHIALLRSYETDPSAIYKHFIPTGLIHPRNLANLCVFAPLRESDFMSRCLHAKSQRRKDAKKNRKQDTARSFWF
jgi:hypothetical protein